MKTLRIIFIAFLTASLSTAAYAVMIGYFPGLGKLIDAADAIVILRIDKHYPEFDNDSLLSMNECFIYQTLKGDIPANQRIRLQLLDTQTSFVPPFAIWSSHLVFLIKKQSETEPTAYRSLALKGSNVRLQPLGLEKPLEGKTIEEKVRSLLKLTLAGNEKAHGKEKKFLESILK